LHKTLHNSMNSIDDQITLKTRKEQQQQP